MTAPDRPVQDVIAEVVMRHRPDLDGFCICDDPVNVRCTGAHIAAAVVAACREATVEQQAELVDATVERTNAPQWFDTGKPDVEHLVTGDGGTVHDVRFVPSSRLVGPWREDPS